MLRPLRTRSLALKIKSQRDFAAGLVFGALGVAFALGSSYGSASSSAKPGLTVAPLLLSILLGVLGAMLLFRSLAIEADGGDPIGTLAWRPLVFTLLALAVFALGVPRLGLLLTLPLVAVLASLASGAFTLKRALGLALLIALCAAPLLATDARSAWPLWPRVTL